MDHSVAAYLARLPKEKVEQLWQRWIILEDIPPNISPELIEILKMRYIEIKEQEKTP
jgi:hypothetical protein